MDTVLAKINKQNNLVKIFLTVFVFVFLFLFVFGINTPLAEAKSTAQEDACIGGWFTRPLICLAISLFKVLSAFVSIAVSFFGWVVDPAKLTAVIASDSVYLAWKNVRDFLNIAFILFLLFSAFCTIFQVSKYSIKNTWLNIVLMALLVNFSFPIARFVIDISNSLAYTLLAVLFPDGLDQLPGAFAGMSNIGDLIYPGDAELVPLVFADIFLFLFAVTFLVMSLLFALRIIALAIIIIFSPVAFTGSIIPGLQDKAAKWWEQLFSYSFFAPIMIFMIYIATGLTASMTVEMEKSLPSIAGKNFSDPSWLVRACTFTVPIVILWIGMAFGKSMSGEAGGAIVGYAQKKMKGIGKSVSGFNFVKKQYDNFAGARKKRKEEIAKNSFGSKIGTALNKGQDTLISKLTGPKGAAAKRLKKTKTTDFDDDAKKAADKHDATATGAIHKHLISKSAVIAASDPANRAAAIDFAGQYKQLISDPVRKAEHEGDIRLKHQTAASAAATAAGIAPQDRSAYMEAFIQREIATSWGNMRANYNKVKKAHTDIK